MIHLTFNNFGFSSLLLLYSHYLLAPDALDLNFLVNILVFCVDYLLGRSILQAKLGSGMAVCSQCPRPASTFPTTSLQFDKYSACLLLLIRQITLPKDLGTLRCLQRTHYFGAHKASISKISQICASPFVL